MKEDRPSAMAESVAMRRAAHQLLDDPRVLDDPVALRIIGKEGASELAADPRRLETSPLSSYLRAFLAARSRLAEDELAEGVRRGVRRYVILGAGLDTFAYRNPYPEGKLAVFEVDHPSTQAFKRARLEEAGIPHPVDLTFAAVDFETQTLAQGLAAAGCGPDAPAFFSWLGVTQYLSAETVRGTLGFVASFPAGSGIVFDYTISPSLMTPFQRTVFDALAGYTAAAGEPWQTFFDPDMLTEELFALGFGYVRDNGPDEINARYFAGRADSLKVGSLAHLMCARV